MNTLLFRKWWLVTLKGIFIIALGLALLLHPYLTTQAFVIFMGATLLAVGISVFFFALANRHSLPNWRWFLTEGIMEVLAGGFLLFQPLVSLYVIMLLSGFWIFFLGGFQIAFGWYFKEKIKGWKYPIAYGILAVIIGVVIIFYPISGIIGFAVMFGITLLALGISLIKTSWSMKNHLSSSRN